MTAVILHHCYAMVKAQGQIFCYGIHYMYLCMYVCMYYNGREQYRTRFFNVKGGRVRGCLVEEERQSFGFVVYVALGMRGVQRGQQQLAAALAVCTLSNNGRLSLCTFVGMLVQ